MLDPDAAREKWPLIRQDDVLGAVWLPHDGRVIPGHTAIAMALGARNRGAIIAEQTRVEEVLMKDDRAVGVRTDRGELQAEVVILTGGMWTRQLGLGIGVDIPLYPVEHHYVLSEPIEGAERHFPCGRDPDAAIYFRTLDDGSIKVGAFQNRTKPWMVERIPDDFSFGLLEDDWERFASPLAAVKHRIPALEGAQFPKFVNGPESFTPDNQFLMGPPPEVDGLFILAGFNSTGIACAGGAGKAAAEWLEDGAPSMDLWSVDIRRFLPFHNDRAYLRARVEECLGLHYQLAWPNREMETARGVRWTPLADRLRARNAAFGSSMGWERANWFAPPGVEPKAAYSFQRQNWAPHVAAEVRACRENVAIFDQSTFSKYLFRGEDALPVLQRLCGANVDVPLGQCVYTSLFNERGTFESDLTLVRLRPDEFYIVSATTQTVRDRDWIERNVSPSEDAQLLDVTTAMGVVSVMGPKARQVLGQVTETSLSNGAFPFATAREIEIAGRRARALRLTYVGELGWELHASFEDIPIIYDALIEAGDPIDMKPAGHYAINAMRLEKAYRAWSHELSTDDTPLEAGLAFALDWKTEFLGREALLELKAGPLRKRLVSLVLEDPEPQLWGSEPILQNGEIVGYTTSAATGPTLDRGVALGYVRHPEDVRAAIREGGFAIRCDGRDHKAVASLKAPYDPGRSKLDL